MNSSKTFEHGRFVPGSATYPQGRTAPKPSFFKRLKKLVAVSHSTSPRSPSNTTRTSPVESQRRRAEALKACGLLNQSVKYGGPYRDGVEKDDTKTIISHGHHGGDDAEKQKDLFIFDEEVELSASAQDRGYTINSDDEQLMTAFSLEAPLPASIKSPVSGSAKDDSVSVIESDTSTLAPRQPFIRMRRIGSLTEELDQIKDEESRRLTEVAFLS